MADVDEILTRMRRSPRNIRFSDLCKVCDFYFGEPRRTGGSHRVYRMPWAGDPRINIQKEGDKAKIYQVRHALKAIERLEVERGKNE
ncbi:MAG: toxin HicA [Dehalococcoidia bacterium]